MAQDPLTGSNDRFPLTRLSVIERVRGTDGAQRRQALDLLCEAYWKPVYKYVRLRWGRAPADAQDLTQGFFVEMFERESLKRFDSSKSRLRTYLRLCIDSFVINEDKAAHRQKRGGGVEHLTLDFSGAEQELGGAALIVDDLGCSQSLEEFFEKEWIRSLFSLAVDDLSRHCVRSQRQRAFRIFEAYDLEGDKQISYASLAEQFGVAVSEVTNELAWARREFRKIALARLRELCGTDQEFQREAKALFGWDAR